MLYAHFSDNFQVSASGHHQEKRDSGLEGPSVRPCITGVCFIFWLVCCYCWGFLFVCFVFKVVYNIFFLSHLELGIKLSSIWSPFYSTGLKKKWTQQQTAIIYFHALLSIDAEQQTYFLRMCWTGDLKISALVKLN